MHHVFDTPGDVELEIKLPSADVTVKTHDEPRTEVEVLARGRRGEDVLEQIVVEARERPGGHVVSIEQQDRIRWGPIAISWGGGIEVRIGCPEGANIEFDGASADLSALGTYGKVVARTASGDLRLGDLGSVQIKTASGDVSIQAIADDSQLQTVSGDVAIDRLDADLTGRSVSGDVELRRVDGAVTLGTTSGDVQIKTVEGGELRVQTVSGDVRIGVAAGIPVWMDAVSVSGDLRSELGDVDAPSDDSVVVPLHVKTVSGDVSFVRAAPVPD
jgi:Putative adhesin